MFDDLNEAANHQQRYFEDTLETYEEYKLNMLKMAGEIEAISQKTTLADINKAIEYLQEEIDKASKKAQEMMKQTNSSLEAQLAALEAQRMQLIQNSQTQISALDSLLGTNSPMVRYLRDVLEKLITKNMPDGGKKPSIPNYTGSAANINNGVTTANGALIITALDRQINDAYLSNLGRSVEQAGLEYWREIIQSGKLSISALGAELIRGTTIIVGSPHKQDWIEYYKSQGIKPFAEGGIVTRPTMALIGEAGYSEAVLPLDGRKLQIDTGDDFKRLASKSDRLERVMDEVAKGVRELVVYIRGVMTEDGEAIQTKVIA
ncbi:hypothetical protein [Campylobacter sp. RM16187]|uniref:hypothetical protein n=1 Tax=Campylobacter sp. RM16187 TaxID=1660063 RepID=UPI0021B59B02|nr:hypothetical protein [Campylobacter sp. RM16187]